MDKNAIKKYAVWARNELIARVSQKAEQYEISATADPKADAVRGVLLSKDEKEQRAKLIGKVKEKGMDQVMEEVAYTWFNRFSALHFMEVNNYLPTRVRVFTDESGAFKPQILDEAIHIELKGLDMEKVYALKEANDNDALFKYLIITQCNALSEVLPGMFQKISDYTELLFPDNLLREGSVVEQMVTMIPEEDWKDQIQIIGWLYQYYNTEPKDKVFSELKKKIKITKEKIPAATQLFTPDWIVRYMVENSLGRLWAEGHPDTTIKSEWKYYLDEAEQDPDVQKQLDEIRKEYSALKPEEIRVIDPCSGSGHICAYLFDVLMQIYGDYGIQAREAVRSIIENNLWGLDIDERAAQLAYFSVMMKAVQYDSRFLKRKDEDGKPDIPQPHIYAICESNNLDTFAIEYFVNGDSALNKDMRTLIDELRDAKEYGSILHTSEVNFDGLINQLEKCKKEISMYKPIIEQDIQPFIQVAKALSQKYHVVVTNPPYMGSNGMSGKLSEYVKRNYPDTKSDLFSVFIERCRSFASVYYAMITQQAFMFLSSFEKLRGKLCGNFTVNMAHLGTRAFDEIAGEVVQTTAFVNGVLRNEDYIGTYIRLVNYNGEKAKEEHFFDKENKYLVAQNEFSRIPGSPIAYWVDESVFSAFKNGKNITTYIDTFQGIITGDNNKFLRLWYELDVNRIAFHAKNMDAIDLSRKYWIPYNKGGEFRKWYGNQDYVVYWKNGPADKTRGKKGFSNYYLREYVSWSYITTSTLASRYFPQGFLWDVSGSGIFDKSNMLYYLQAFISSTVGIELLKIINPTINYQVENIAQLPVLISNKDEVDNLVKENINLAKLDWDSYETSWDFQINPLVHSIGVEHYIADEYKIWKFKCDDAFNTVLRNEETINKIFIDTYHMYSMADGHVANNSITMRKTNVCESVKEFISYAVGCMFGRYSLDRPGLIYAGGEWNSEAYKTFAADKDGILPVCDDEYFDDDITSYFCKFVETVYGKTTLEQNLKFIADALGGNGTAREIIREYFLNGFYTDHCNRYSVSGSGKRPIYWLFDSGKNNGFKCLIYIHRYQTDTLARIRTDYVHEQQERYRTAISGIERQIVGATSSEKITLNKKLVKLKTQADETRVFEEKIHHLADQMIPIDLDQGIKHNYEIFKDVLAKI